MNASTNKITVSTVVENTKAVVMENLSFVTVENWDELVCRYYDVNGIDGLKELENSITIMEDVGNIEGIIDFVEELYENYC